MKTLDLTPYRCADGTVRRFTDVGGYPLFYLTADNGVLCADCVQSERPDVADEEQSDDWRIVAADVNWEEAVFCCDHCSDRIESAYAEKTEPEDDSPQEDDITTEDHSRFYQSGRCVLVYHDDGTANYLPSSAADWRLLGTFDDYRAALRAYMEATQYWPNCWFISDHGNAHLITLSEGK